MKLLTIILTLVSCCSLQAQVSFKTVVPQQPVVEGEAFQVQYVLTGAEKTNAIRTPVFAGFRLISGPNIYDGSSATAGSNKTVQNFVYTLEAVRPGRFIIPAALVAANNKPLQSNEAIVRVISKEEAKARPDNKGMAFGSDYLLRPGEDPIKKIRDNLFIKILVDRKSCFIGEAIVATFKLYSRLESKSDIVKNPGFYGFTVHDMVNLADRHVGTEQINGRMFDVHTVRKVQLYPLRAGHFVIDAMELSNKVQFSKGLVAKKTEQEIAEGMMAGSEDEPAKEGTEVYESNISTPEVTVHVKPLPEKNRPALFSGAVGMFKISATIESAELAKNEQGYLEITISGKGNFTQLSAPAIQWPAGVEGFEPAVKDNLDKNKAPLSGERIFRFPFVCAAAGTYMFQPVSFSYFDTDSNSYKTISSNQVEVVVSNKERTAPGKEKPKSSFAEQNERAARIAGGIALLAVLFIIGYWLLKKREPEPAYIKKTEVKEVPSVSDILMPAVETVAGGDKEFFTALRSAVWAFFRQYFALESSIITRQLLIQSMNEKGLSGEVVQQLTSILEKCEEGIFTGASLQLNKEQLLSDTKDVLEAIEQKLL